MYIPHHFKNDNTEEVKNFIRENSFGILIAQGDKLLATHIPLQLNKSGNSFTGHISKANPQAKYLMNNMDVLLIFQGPNTYISSSWYNHENVSTWNYIAVHVYGTVALQNEEQLYAALKDMTDRYEKESVKPVSIEQLSAGYLQSQMRGVVGFEITIKSIEAAYKLSKNRDEVNHNNIIKALEQRGDHNANAIAHEMKKRVF